MPIVTMYISGSDHTGEQIRHKINAEYSGHHLHLAVMELFGQIPELTKRLWLGRCEVFWEGGKMDQFYLQDPPDLAKHLDVLRSEWLESEKDSSTKLEALLDKLTPMVEEAIDRAKIEEAPNELRQRYESLHVALARSRALKLPELAKREQDFDGWTDRY